MRVLALDVGTSSVKAAVLDVASCQPVRPKAHVAYPLDHPTPDAAEVPAQRLWSAVASAARQAVRKADGVEGIGMSVLTPALVLLDEADRPVLPIWTHLDRRARQAARQTWAAVGQEFLAETGNRPLPGGMSAVCFKQMVLDDPYIIRRVKSYLHVNGWLALRMTGDRAFDPANASFTGLYGTLTTQAWSARWCEYFEVEPSWLPPVVSGDTTIGTLRSEAAVELGVTGGLPVKLGTADTSCAMLGAGMGPGDLLHSVGTTEVLAAFTDRPRPDPRRLTRQFGVGNAFVHLTHNPVGGAALSWLRELCFREQNEQEFYEQTIPHALERATRITLDPPFLGGDRLEIEAHRAAFRDLTLATDRLDLLSALLQAMLREHQKALVNLGLRDQFRRIFLTGGGAEVVHKLIPGYAGAAVQILDEASLRGIARLFSSAPRLAGCEPNH
jgi:sugar (pentulose or hexulose) kinase